MAKPPKEGEPTYESNVDLNGSSTFNGDGERVSEQTLKNTESESKTDKSTSDNKAEAKLKLERLLSNANFRSTLQRLITNVNKNAEEIAVTVAEKEMEAEKEEFQHPRETPSPGLPFELGDLIWEVHEALKTEVTGVVAVGRGVSCWGITFSTTNAGEIVARVGHGGSEFEIAIHKMLQDSSKIRASNLLYHRFGRSNTDWLSAHNTFIFKGEKGENGRWKGLSMKKQKAILEEFATVRAALFNFTLPDYFLTRYAASGVYVNGVGGIDPLSFCTREKWIWKLSSEINLWMPDPPTSHAKSKSKSESESKSSAKKTKIAILKAIPYSLPLDNDPKHSMYSMVLEHGDFHLGNALYILGGGDDDERERERERERDKDKDKVTLTSLFDFGDAEIRPRFLSDPGLTLEGCVRIGIDEMGGTVLYTHGEPEEEGEGEEWAMCYAQKLFSEAMGYERIVDEFLDVRDLLFILDSWDECSVAKLGRWARRLLRKHGAV